MNATSYDSASQGLEWQRGWPFMMQPKRGELRLRN